MNAPANVEQKQPQPRKGGGADFRQQLAERMGSFADALPPHVRPEQFKSVVAWAVMADPNLLTADRVSLFEACLAAANDGLLPDKKEGALVSYRSRLPNVKDDKGKDIWIDKVQWLPMIRGVITKVHNTGKVKTAKVGIVRAGEQFRYWTDDLGDHLLHEPGDDENAPMVRVYAQVIMTDAAGGGVYIEVMGKADIDRVKAASKSPEKGPWATWYEEMAKKTVFKRLFKRLPISREIATVLDRDHFLYDLEAKREANNAPRLPAASLTSRLDALAAGQTSGQPDHDPETGEIKEQNSTSTRKHTTDGDRQDVDTSAGRDTADGKAADGGGSSQDPSSAADKSGPDASTSAGPASSGGQKEAASPTGSPAAQPSSDAPRETSSDDGTPSPAQAREAGRKARADGLSRKAVPAKFRTNEALLENYLAGFDGEREPGEDG